MALLGSFSFQFFTRLAAVFTEEIGHDEVFMTVHNLVFSFPLDRCCECSVACPSSGP